MYPIMITKLEILFSRPRRPPLIYCN